MVNFKEDEALNTLNHSCAHLMAQAIRHLYPQAKFWVGPVVAEGFYYDVDFGDHVFKEEDLAAIGAMPLVCRPFSGRPLKTTARSATSSRRSKMWKS